MLNLSNIVSVTSTGQSTTRDFETNWPRRNKKPRDPAFSGRFVSKASGDLSLASYITKLLAMLFPVKCLKGSVRFVIGT